MLTIHSLRSAILVLFGVCSAFGQAQRIEIYDFLVDGRSIECEYSVKITADGRKFVPKVTNGSFLMPNRYRKSRSFDLTVTCGAYTVRMTELGAKRFYSRLGGGYLWTIGIDSPPFEEANVDAGSESYIGEVHFIKFHPEGLVSTQLQVFRPIKRRR